MHQLRYKIGKRAKEKRAEVEARQRETRRSGSAPKRNAPNWNRVKMEVAKVNRAKLTRVKAERANVARNPYERPRLLLGFAVSHARCAIDCRLMIMISSWSCFAFFFASIMFRMSPFINPFFLCLSFTFCDCSSFWSE